jgi:hypothetical protein
MTLPDRLSSDPRSPFFDAELLEAGVGIIFNGKEREDVAEYCVSEGWVRVPAGKSKDRYGQPITIKLKGTVEARFVEKFPTDALSHPAKLDGKAEQCGGTILFLLRLPRPRDYEMRLMKSAQGHGPVQNAVGQNPGGRGRDIRRG